MKCKICNKELKKIGRRHLWTDKCLRVTNDLWYNIDLIKQKEERIEKGINTKNDLIEYKVKFNDYIEMKKKYKELTDYRYAMQIKNNY